MHRGMQWPEPRLTWADGKLVCCTFRVAYEAFRESGRFKQSSKIKVNVASLSHANYGGAVGIWRLMDVLDRNGIRATIGANELRRIQRESGLTSIYVTHDQAEALAISDLIIVMKEGRIVECGRPVDIYRHPRHG